MKETPTFGHAAVAGPHRLAADSGQRVLIEGGNALEAMLAMAATIAVVYPHNNAIGGDGFWLIADRSRRVRFIEACGPAGSKATIAAYRERGYDAIPPRGAPAALTVPGAIGGWQIARDMARAFGGRLPLDTLLADAVRHARDGVPVSASQGRIPSQDIEELARAPGFSGQFMSGGKALAPGAPMVQSALADTLEQLAHAGLDDFYRGDIGRELAADLERFDSPVARDDLTRFEARVREPLMLPIMGGRLFGTPPPTQGLASLITLGLFERLGVRRAESFDHIHGLIEAVKRAAAVRDRVVTDPAFLTVDPGSFLVTSFLDRETQAIRHDRAGPLVPIEAKGDTVWMGAIDADGLAVSYIQSVFWDFGSGVVLPRTGVLMHNRGLSFSLDPRALNPLAPGRRPFHTLSPALALFDDGRAMPFGTMGGEAQPQIMAQVFSRFRLGAGLADAIDAPRFVLGRARGSKETLLKLENRFDERLVQALADAGHPTVVDDVAYSDDYGHAGALLRHAGNGRIEAEHDPRSDGGAAGL